MSPIQTWQLADETKHGVMVSVYDLMAVLQGFPMSDKVLSLCFCNALRQKLRDPLDRHSASHRFLEYPINIGASLLGYVYALRRREWA